MDGRARDRTGAVARNHDMNLGRLLRSWKERFGAYVVDQRPPTTKQQALAIAAEHCAISSDIVYQGAGSLEVYAAEILQRPLPWD